jgi:hypothetical protein
MDASSGHAAMVAHPRRVLAATRVFTNELRMTSPDFDDFSGGESTAFSGRYTIDRETTPV